MVLGDKEARKIAERALWLIERYTVIASRPKSYGTSMRFHRLDIHMLHLIGSEPGINVTDLAFRLRISKAAVSQTIKKLEKRELVERYQLPGNRKEIRFRPTAQGMVAYEAHARFHETIESPVLVGLSQLTEDEAIGAERLLEILEERARMIEDAIDGERS